jgi:hypothetical protein
LFSNSHGIFRGFLVFGPGLTINPFLLFDGISLTALPL